MSDSGDYVVDMNRESVVKPPGINERDPFIPNGMSFAVIDEGDVKSVGGSLQAVLSGGKSIGGGTGDRSKPADRERGSTAEDRRKILKPFPSRMDFQRVEGDPTIPRTTTSAALIPKIHSLVASPTLVKLPMVSMTSSVDQAVPNGTHLHWHDLKVSVQVAEKIDEVSGRVIKQNPLDPRTWCKRAPKKQKMILNGISGDLQPGEILLVMGPSGSGKTTLLDLLADRMSLPSTGDIFVDGVSRTEDSYFQTYCKYVPQNDDAFYSSFTVERVMGYSAEFYCADPEQRKDRIEAALTALGLLNQRKVPVGGMFQRGLSGGQRRRLSVACELLATPRLLILDEPTSGLDSAASFHLMESLTSLVRATGTTVICSIHQPSELIFNQSDKLLLMSRGRQIYFGPTKDVKHHFASAGVPKTPESNVMSTAEWVIDEINDDFAEVGSEYAELHMDHIKKLTEYWPISGACEDVSDEHERIKEHCQKRVSYLGGGSAEKVERESSDRDFEESSTSVTRKKRKEKAVGSKYNRPFMTQVMILLKRGFIVWLSNPVLFIGRFLFTLLIFCFICLVYGHLDYTYANLNLAFPAVIYFVLGYGPVIGMSSIAAVQEEGYMIERERANGAFAIEAWSVARFILLLCFMIVLTILPVPVLYFIVHLIPRVGNFFFFVWTLFWMNICMEYIIHLAAGAFRQTVMSVLAVSGYVGISALLFGFLKPLDEIGWWVRWLHYLTAGSWAFVALCINQFNDPERCYYLTLSDGTQECVLGSSFLDYLGFRTSNAAKWGTSAALIPYTFIVALALYLLEKFIRKGRR